MSENMLIDTTAPVIKDQMTPVKSLDKMICLAVTGRVLVR